MINILTIIFVYLGIFIRVHSETICEVRARTESGWVCGLRQVADNGVEYASFRGIPYAQQPLGELRFRELQPARPWPHHLNATKEGPRCPQHDELYSRMVQTNQGMSEACIYANIHVPLDSLPPNKHYNDEDFVALGRKGLPILVFIHGGGFHMGSGDTDQHGPDHLVGTGVVVVTFNYRINVFGFLSLNTTKIPGNAGLRDMVTLLRWVQRNARTFGGDPNEVTLSGQSAGAACAHLLSLSAEAKGLFKRVILMSGTAIPAFYSSAPTYATFIATLFFRAIGINSTDPDLIHDQLINIPIERIMKANSEVQYQSGLVSFVPVVESKHPGITRVLDNDPITLIEQGRGKDYPIIIGFTTEECEFFKWRLEYLNFLKRIKTNPLLVLSAGIIFTVPPNVGLSLAEKVMERYFNGKPTLEKTLDLCKETLFHYPSFKLAEWRSGMDGAPVYLYEYSYESEHNLVKDALYLDYKGSAHVEDLTMIFRNQAMLGPVDKFYSPKTRDDFMKEWMTNFVVNFMHCSKPICSEPEAWLAVQPKLLNYQAINEPGVYQNTPPTPHQKAMLQFHDRINAIASNSTIIASR